MLPIAMLTGASIYLIYHIMPEPVHKAGPFLDVAVSLLQPLLIFSMLFLTFCRIEPKELKPHRWHWWLLLIQGGLFTALGLLAVWMIKAFPGAYHDKLILIESAMLCLICPTATAAAVVTRKLGGDVPGITTYVVLINILAALLVPLIVPMLHPVEGMDFWTAFSMIMVKVFPLLITPCLCAWIVRYMAPRLHRWFMRFPDLPFYLWAVALTLAITVTTKSIVNSTISLRLLLLMALISLICCIFQFAAGRFVGSRYRPRRAVRSSDCGSRGPCHPRHESGGTTSEAKWWGERSERPRSHSLKTEQRGREIRKVTAGQALGQKNTVFAIWMAYTFMIPETAIIGGLYSIWHNIYNSHQLRKAEEAR